VVPTGNFGDIFAGYCAAKMGLPIQRLVVATNRNDIVSRFFERGDYRKGQVAPTLSPSMDIQVSSNFERLLFDLHGRDGATLRGLMAEFDKTGGITVSPNAFAVAKPLFAAGKADEAETIAAIGAAFQNGARLVDPHSAVGLHVAAEMRRSGAVPADTPLVTLATADPAKFPDAVLKATGHKPELPPRLADLMQQQERFTRLPNDAAKLIAFIEGLKETAV
jgi:threonine synthase